MKYINKFKNLKNNKLNILYILYFKLINNREKNMSILIGVLVFINEGEKLIRLSGLIEGCNDNDVWNELSVYLSDDELEVLNDLVCECKVVGDEDVSWYEDEIDEVNIVDYCNGFKKFVNDMKNG